MNKFLTEAGWKSVLQKNKGKFKDNGLQRALAAHEKLKEDAYDDRLKALKLVFKLALDLSGAKDLAGFADVRDHLSRVAEFAVKEQEAVDKQKKAAAVSEGEKIMLRNMIVAAAKDISQSAKANTALFGIEVLKACKAFEVHAKSKLDGLEDAVTAEQLLGSLVSIVVPDIAEKLAEGVSQEIGKKLVKHMGDAIGGTLGDVVKSAGKDSSKGALEKAVTKMVLAAQDAQGSLLNVVMKELIPLCDDVIGNVNAGKELNARLTEFIEPFILEQSAKVDSMLEARFGVPSPAKSKQTQLQIFKNMVRVFEEKLDIASTPSGAKTEWVIKGVPESVRRNADAKSQQAGRQREKEMGV